jgi:hypothetical protein
MTLVHSGAVGSTLTGGRSPVRGDQAPRGQESEGLAAVTRRDSNRALAGKRRRRCGSLETKSYLPRGVKVARY